jgi:hypothetical protein
VFLVLFFCHHPRHVSTQEIPCDSIHSYASCKVRGVKSGLHVVSLAVMQLHQVSVSASVYL